MTPCTKAPKGWKCTREAEHEGPCAAVKIPWYKQLFNALGEAVGQSKFGQ